MKHLKRINVSYYMVGATDRQTSAFLGSQARAWGRHGTGVVVRRSAPRRWGRGWAQGWAWLCVVCAQGTRHPCFKFFEDGKGHGVGHEYK